MSYETAAGLSQMFTLVLFASIMALVIVYALRPANKSRFDRASRLPLEADDPGEEEGNGNGRS